MKTYLKKVSALFIAFVMMLAMCVPAFAGTPGNDNVYGQANDRGNIAVKGIEQGATVEAYKIIQADYSNDGYEFSGYSLVSEYNSMAAPTDGDWKNWVTEAKMTAIAKIIVEQSVAKSYDMSWDEQSQSYKNDNVEIGAYLVLVKDVEGVYAPIVTSVYYTYNEQTDENGVTETVLDITSEPAWAKVQTQPTIVKKILVNGEEVDGNTQNIGGEVEYKVTVDIPSYTGNYPVFKISDTMTNLTYTEDFTMIASKDGLDNKTLTKGTDFTFATDKDITTAVNGKEFEVDFVVNGKFMLQDYAGGKLTITYKAILDAKDTTVRNDDSGNAGNPNTVTLTYTTNSNVQGSEETVDDTVKTYTFKIEEDELVKVDSANSETALEGAEFTLYTDAECTTVYKNGIIANGIVISDASGNIIVDGLAAGTYYMKETKAPDGYALTNHVYKIEVTAGFEDENLKTWSIKVDDNELDGADVAEQGKLEIKNTKDSELPSTGGIGTYIFTIVGVVMMAAAAGMLFMKRRGEAE